MASRKRREPKKVTPGKVASQARRNNKNRTKVSIPSYRPSRKKAYNPARSRKRSVTDVNPRFQAPLGPVDPAKLARDTRTRVINALSEGRENPKFSFSKLAKRWHLDTRSFYRHAKQAIKIDASGRVRVRPNDRLRVVQQIPSTKPGEYRTIVTRSYKERQILGEWWAAINEAKAGKFARLDAFPKNTLIEGVRLPTGRFEVQKQLEALEAEGSKFAGPYRVHSAAGARS